MHGTHNSLIAAILRLFAPCAAQGARRGHTRTPLAGPAGQAGAEECGGAGVGGRGGAGREVSQEGDETTTDGAIHVAVGSRCRRKRRRSCSASVDGRAGVESEVRMRGQGGGVEEGGCGQEVMARVEDWVRHADDGRDLRVRCLLVVPSCSLSCRVLAYTIAY